MFVSWTIKASRPIIHFSRIESCLPLSKRGRTTEKPEIGTKVVLEWKNPAAPPTQQCKTTWRTLRHNSRRVWRHSSVASFSALVLPNRNRFSRHNLPVPPLPYIWNRNVSGLMRKAVGLGEIKTTKMAKTAAPWWRSSRVAGLR
mmetsp:Transcript_17077/g.47980  ORF Transcript_17077/g.47980 Transcript_17077/m.47980 type:complete len:144 (+) Transcript_17077:2073-2504(+)